MNPILKQPHLFSNWRGNNATIMKIYQRGKDDFSLKRSENKQFGPNHPLLSHKMLDEYYLMRKKIWENEGIPREEFLIILYDENGSPATFCKKSQKSPVELLRDLQTLIAQGSEDQKKERRTLVALVMMRIVLVLPCCLMMTFIVSNDGCWKQRWYEKRWNGW